MIQYLYLGYLYLYTKFEVYLAMSVDKIMNKIRLVLGWSSDIEDDPE